MICRRGFTLIELIAVLVIVSVGMLGVAKLFATTNLTLSRATDEQVLSQYAQECAETILKTRRVYGMSATFTCEPAPTNYTRTVSITNPAYTGTASTACPIGISCLDVTVTVVCTGSSPPCPATSSTASVKLTLVTY